MRVEYDLENVAPLGPAVLTIGFFDGVHHGHRRLIERAAELARVQSARAVVVTFWPHPVSIVRPEVPVSLLTTLEEKLELLAGLDQVDCTVVMPFTPELAATDPEDFLARLDAFCRPLALVEGSDFAVGHNRAGDLAFLRAAGVRHGFAVETLEVREDSERVSSSRIRALVREGRIADVTRLLGRSYTLTGEVVEGDRRGRALGFPTANLRLDARKILPANGVYAVRVCLPGERSAAHAGVCNIGVRPTFGGEPRLHVEVYLLDATIDLYGLTLAVEVVARLREERRFTGVDALKAQIATDVEQARAHLLDQAGPEPIDSLTESSIGQLPDDRRPRDERAE